MIKAILMFVSPTATWAGIVERKRGVLGTLLTYVLPLLLFTTAAEVWSMVKWGRQLGVREDLVTVPMHLACTYGVAQFALSLASVFIGAQLVKAVGETFHGRHSFAQAFTAVGYSFGPLFLMRLTEIWPQMNAWVAWALGVLLMLAALYHGIPRALEPDPAHAFGLYFISSVLLTVVTGLARLLASEVLRHQLRLVSDATGVGAG